MGVRLGAFILGTDPEAPMWSGLSGPPLQFVMPRFDPAAPLPFYARYIRDGELLPLPSWHMLDLVVDGVRFQPGQGLFRGESRLDLRTGEASLTGVWSNRSWLEPEPRTQVKIKIALLMPRSVNHGGFFELSVEGENCQIEASIGWHGRHLPEMPIVWREKGSHLLGDGVTPTRQRPVRLGAHLDLVDGTLSQTRIEDGDAKWLVHGVNRLNLAMSATVHGGMENNDIDQARIIDLGRLATGRADGSLRRDNEATWKELWAQSLDVTILPPGNRQLVLAQEYYLLASSDDAPWPTGPQGIAGNNWRGQQMWDNDLWTFRALLPSWPKLAESMLAARLHQLPEARKVAAAEGCAGAKLTGDENGIDTTTSLYRHELHLGAWSAFGVWDFWLVTRDKELLRRYWPILRDTSQFFASRCIQDADGSWHLRGVVPPDEYVCEHSKRTCDDSITTNLVVRSLLRSAQKAAHILGEPSEDLWREVSENLVTPGPDDQGIVPEFEGYAGETVKQADVALAFYPLGLDLPENIIRKNIAYYRDRRDLYGPLMSSQIDACVLMRLGDRHGGLRMLFEGYLRHVKGPFLVPTEGIHNNVAGFITGCGGLLLALIYGYTKYREPGDDLELIPRLSRQWETSG